MRNQMKAWAEYMPRRRRSKRCAKRAVEGARSERQHAVEQFLYRQADLLDRKHWQDWIDLFTDDGVYWMPPEPPTPPGTARRRSSPRTRT